jgi:hypothetical protein
MHALCCTLQRPPARSGDQRLSARRRRAAICHQRNKRSNAAMGWKGAKVQATRTTGAFHQVIYVAADLFTKLPVNFISTDRFDFCNRLAGGWGPKVDTNAFVRLGQFRTLVCHALVRRTSFRVCHAWRAGRRLL